MAASSCASEKPPQDSAAAPASQSAKTVKPGAGVEVSHSQRGAVAPGAIGVAEFSFVESYADGSMSVEAKGSEGLEIIPSQARAIMPMGDRTDHRWDVSFRAASAGVYYVDLMIAATMGGGEVETRSYSARVVVGDPGSAAKPAAQTEMIDGEPVVVMEADETVID